MPRLPHRRLDEHPANPMVTLVAAANLYGSAAVDYPVSADETLRERGRAAVRTAHRGSIIWRQDWVRPKLATAGIRAGDTITALDSWGEYRTGIATRVGTIAGWASTDGLTGDHEWRWDVADVTTWPQPIDPAHSVH